MITFSNLVETLEQNASVDRTITYIDGKDKELSALQPRWLQTINCKKPSSPSPMQSCLFKMLDCINKVLLYL